MRPPLAAPAAAVSAGVFAARFADFSTLDTLVFAAAAAGLAAWGLRAPAAGPGAAACLLGFALSGAWLADIPAENSPCRVDRVLERMEFVPGETVRLTGWARRPSEDFGDADRVELEAETVFDGVPACGTVRVNIHRAPEHPPLGVVYGQRLEFLAQPRPLDGYQNPGGFDRADYLRAQGFSFAASARAGAPILRLDGRRGSAFEAFAWRLRTALRARFDALESAAGRPSPVLRAMLLGDRGELSASTRTAFERSGTYHTLVVSGLHVGVAAAALLALARFAGAPRWAAAAAAAALAGGYAWLLGGATPVSRAAWMLVAYLAAMSVFRQRQPLNVVAGVAAGLLLWRPALLAEAGFQLSFLSVAAIAGLAAPLLERTTEPRRKALRDLWNVDLDLHLAPESAARRVALRTWLEPLAEAARLPRGSVSAVVCGGLRAWWGAAAIALVSAVLAVALAAPLAWHFQRVAGAGPVANVVALPLVSVTVPAGLAALAADSPRLFAAAAALADALEANARRTASLDGVDWRVPPPPWWLAALAGASLLAWGAGLRRGGRAAWVASTAAAAVFVIVALHPFPARLEPARLELAAIDVGQGDSFLLGLPDATALLVDAGGAPGLSSGSSPFDVGEEVVSPYLWSRSVRRLRALAVTHADVDHMGGAAAVLRNFRVEELWIGRGQADDEYAPLLALAAERGAAIRRLGAGDRFDLGGAGVEVLAPEAGAAGSPNERSLALMLRWGGHEFLLTGDLESGGEAALARRLERMGGVEGDVLAGLHHGSRTSSTSALLKAFRPSFAVLSAGRHNVHGHPHPEALERLAAAGVVVLRTDRRGALRIVGDGRRLEVR